MAGKVTLKATKGPLAGKVFEFSEADTFVFGRALDCHFRIPEEDPYAARYQFLLEVIPPVVQIRDLGSLNGTFVNGVKQGGREPHESPAEGSKRVYASVALQHGDRIEAGDTCFAVEIDARSPPPDVAPTLYREPGTSTPAPVVNEPVQPVEEPKGKLAELVQAVLFAARRRAPVGEIREIPGYAFETELGRGGMGAVYLARRLADSKRVALKLMLAQVALNAHAVKTFLREASIATQLRHENIVETYELGRAGKVFYFTMELCDGGCVETLMNRSGGRLPLAVAGPIMLQALDGLDYAHNVDLRVPIADGSTVPSKGVIHRDLKPANILLAGPEGRRTAKITDYGLAKCFNVAGLSGHTMTGAVAGTPVFMPREQVIQFKKVKPVSDVWAMGATLYNMLTGATPREFELGQDPIAVILRDPIVPIRKRDSRISSRLAEVIDQAIEIDPNQRFQTARAFRKALEKVL